MDGCDEALSLLHGTELGYYCAAVATQGLDPFCANPGALCNRFLDLTGPLYLGGIPEGQRETRIKSKHFNGCIQNLEIDSKFVDLSDYFEEHGTEKGSSSHAKRYVMQQAKNPCMLLLVKTHKCYSSGRQRLLGAAHERFFRFPPETPRRCNALWRVSSNPRNGTYFVIDDKFLDTVISTPIKRFCFKEETDGQKNGIWH